MFVIFYRIALRSSFLTRAGRLSQRVFRVRLQVFTVVGLQISAQRNFPLNAQRLLTLAIVELKPPE